MPATPVVAVPLVRGLAPVAFLSEDTAVGTQYQIPISSLTYDKATNAISAVAGWAPAKGKKLAANDTTLLGTLLADLLKRGILWIEWVAPAASPAPPSPPPPSPSPA